MKRVRKKLKWNAKNRFIIIFQTLRTFFIVCLGYIFFRAESIQDAALIFRKIFTGLSLSPGAVKQSLIPFGNGHQAIASALILAVLILGLFIYELLEERQDDRLSRHRLFLAAAMIAATGLLGIFGQSNFLYQAF